VEDSRNPEALHDEGKPREVENCDGRLHTLTMYNLNILCTLQNNQLYSLYLYYNSFEYVFTDTVIIIYCSIISILSLPSYTIQQRHHPRQNSLCGMTAAYIRRVRLDRSKQNSLISHAANIDNPNGHASFVCSFH